MVVDADVLYGGTTRGLLAYLDHARLIRMHWSPLLIDEMHRALVATLRLDEDAARVNDDALHRAVPDASVPVRDVHAAFRTAWPGVNDSKDLHVAACAVAMVAGRWYSSASTVHLITRNAKDFAPKKLARLDVVQQHPDAFLLALWQDRPAAMADAFRAYRDDLPSHPDVDALLDRLARDGQRRTAAAMARAHAAGLHVL